MRTKGALLWEFDRPWSVEEIEIGDAGRGQRGRALRVPKLRRERRTRPGT